MGLTGSPRPAGAAIIFAVVRELSRRGSASFLGPASRALALAGIIVAGVLITFLE